MNAEILISQAGYAIDMFQIDYFGPCCLCIRDGFVHAVPAMEIYFQTPVALLVSVYEQEQGLTPRRWAQIGASLLEFYYKEKSCRQPQKP